jgi:asparagine synthase (glutamine-hydrolysing)
MCGIAGIIALEPERFMSSMLSTIEHRGRDDEGIWTSDAVDENSRQVCLGHRRLAIIDTSSAGHQPMQYADGRYVITFNGEIYNYRELREDLKSKGHEFHTDTDTEVLLAAFAEWGADCLPYLNGMFAFAVWDNRERTLTLARDHVGIKPLYYAHLPSFLSSPRK